MDELGEFYRIENHDLNRSNVSAESIEFCIDRVDFVKACISSVWNTNSFMLMSINRCVDFSKASNGVVLQPKLELIDIRVPYWCLFRL